MSLRRFDVHRVHIALGSRDGAFLPTALVARTAKMRPILKRTLYSRSTLSHFFSVEPPDSDSPAPTQCLEKSKVVSTAPKEIPFRSLV